MTVLSNLLSKNRNFSPTYHPNVLANHLSMALIALYKLGASDEQLKKYYLHYSEELEPVQALTNTIQITDTNWMNFLGCAHYFPNYLIFFQKNIQLNGMSETLKKYLQLLIKGLSGQAFHCLIRLAYAVEIIDIEEIAVSLAYFSSHYFSLGDKKKLNPIFKHPKHILNKINSISCFTGVQINGINITERVKKVALIAEFSSVIDWLKPGNTTLSECASILIYLYAKTEDFTVLHMVTVTHAMRILQNYFIDFEDAIRYYWQAICAAYITIGSPSISEFSLPMTKQTNWPTIISKTINSADEHVIKLVYTCYEESKIYNNSLYGHVAVNTINS